jgi:hypothetical protein
VKQKIEFKPSPGYAAYEISSDGETIRRLTDSPHRNFKAGHVMKQRLRLNGYKQIPLVNDDGKKKYLLVHRLVAAAFIGSLGDKQINHKDGVKTNNAVENLELVSAKENMAHSIEVLGNSRAGERHRLAKLKDSDIPVIIERKSRGETCKSLARAFGVSPMAISLICRGKTWKHVASPVPGISVVGECPDRQQRQAKTL